MARVAYVRVSTVEQNEGRQVEALKPHQCLTTETAKAQPGRTTNPAAW